MKFQKGHPGYWKGKQLTEETKRKMSQSQKGREHPWNKGKSPMKGKKHTEEAKQKIREKRKLQVITEETKKKMSEAQKRIGNPGRFKKGFTPWKGKKHSKESKQKISAKKKGQHSSPRTEFKKGMTPWNKGLKDWNAGEKNPAWIDGRSGSKEHRKMLKRRGHRKRRLLKKNVQGWHTEGEWENLKAQYNWTCPCCKKQEPEITLTEDHIIPLSKGGSDNIENIQPLCALCNAKKNTKIIKY